MTIVPLERNSMSRLAPQHVGGKAYSLYQVHKLNISVPRSWVILIDEYMAHLGQLSLEQTIQQASDLNRNLLSIRKAILAAPLRTTLTQALYHLYNCQVSDVSLAVRSSANVEDSQHHSFAGIFESFLGLNSFEEVLYAVRHCWGSVWLPRTAVYCQRIGMPHQLVQMAILIQEMICIRIAGVTFTCDPISLNQNYIVVEATQQSESVVSGRVSPDYYKLSAIDGHSCVVSANSGSLSDDDLKWLWTTAKIIAKQFDSHQEIEWIIDTNGKAYILQTRSITTAQDHR